MMLFSIPNSPPSSLSSFGFNFKKLLSGITLTVVSILQFQNLVVVATDLPPSGLSQSLLLPPPPPLLPEDSDTTTFESLNRAISEATNNNPQQPQQPAYFEQYRQDQGQGQVPGQDEMQHGNGEQVIQHVDEDHHHLVSDILGFRDPPFRELQIIVF